MSRFPFLFFFSLCHWTFFLYLVSFWLAYQMMFFCCYCILIFVPFIYHSSLSLLKCIFVALLSFFVLSRYLLCCHFVFFIVVSQISFGCYQVKLLWLKESKFKDGSQNFVVVNHNSEMRRWNYVIKLKLWDNQVKFMRKKVKFCGNFEVKYHNSEIRSWNYETKSKFWDNQLKFMRKEVKIWWQWSKFWDN